MPDPTRKDWSERGRSTHWAGCWTVHEECEPPRRIYLQDVGGEISWCDTQTGEGEREPEYVRADLVRPVVEALEKIQGIVDPKVFPEDEVEGLSDALLWVGEIARTALANLKGDES